MARDEADIIATTVAHMATQVDHVLVADNLSKDDTARLAADAGAQVVPDSEPAYWQSDKMTGLAAVARSRGAAWVVPFDADEIWHTRSGQRIGDYLAGVDAHVAIADLYDHWTTDAGIANGITFALKKFWVFKDDEPHDDALANRMHFLHHIGKFIQRPHCPDCFRDRHL